MPSKLAGSKASSDISPAMKVASGQRSFAMRICLVEMSFAMTSAPRSRSILVMGTPGPQPSSRIRGFGMDFAFCRTFSV